MSFRGCAGLGQASIPEDGALLLSCIQAEAFATACERSQTQLRVAVAGPQRSAIDRDSLGS